MARIKLLYTYLNQIEMITHADNSTTAMTATNYTYDGNGNLTSGGGLSFTSNAQNQTTAINTDTYNYTGADQTDRVTVNSTNYTYGPLGLGSASDGSANTYYTRDNNGKLVSERTSTGTYYYLLNSLRSVNVVTLKALVLFLFIKQLENSRLILNIIHFAFVP